MNPLRLLARRLAYRSGLLSLPRAKQSDVLTAVMLHRVLDRSDPDFPLADPDYTLESELFDELLGFFSDHFTVISLSDVQDAAAGRRPLPTHALLITFDDGWADNLRFAAPLLQRRALPAVVFAVAEPLLSADNAWWQEQVFAALRFGKAAPILELVARPDGSGSDESEEIHSLEVLCRVADADAARRAEALASLSLPPPASRMMLRPAELPHLQAAGIAVGVHGYTHLPLTHVRGVESEIRASIELVGKLTGNPAAASALSIPHGRYDRAVIRAARAAGAQLIFTSDPILNPTQGGFLDPAQPIGRIAVGTPDIARPSGHLDRSAAATWWWRREIGRAAPAEPTMAFPAQ